MKKVLLFFILLPLLLGCVTPSSKTTFHPLEPQSDISFIDSAIFDKKLSAAMKAEKRMITTELIHPMDPNNIPERLDKWFFAIEEKGGEVKTKTSSADPSFFVGEIFVEILIKTYRHIQEKKLYAPSKNYHATLFYNSKKKTIDKVIFSHKGKGPDFFEEDRQDHKRPHRKQTYPNNDQEQKDAPSSSQEGYLSDIL